MTQPAFDWVNERAGSSWALLPRVRYLLLHAGRRLAVDEAFAARARLVLLPRVLALAAAPSSFAGRSAPAWNSNFRLCSMACRFTKDTGLRVEVRRRRRR